jgi:cytochrome P450
LGCQTGRNPLADSLLNQISWKISNQKVNSLEWLNFVRTIVEWYNGRKMDAYINKQIDERFKASQQQPDNSGGKFESIIDLALQDYMADPSRAAIRELDKDSRTFVTRNIRMLLFAGHDSTGSTISYCYYLLSQNPEKLALIRAEHDSIFGTDLSKAGPAILMIHIF